MNRVASAVGGFQSSFRASSAHGESVRTASRRVPMADDLIIGFPPGHRRLPDPERMLIARWVEGWLPGHPDRVVVMAHDVSAGSATRLARLRALRDAVQRVGVDRENIKYTDLPASALSDRAGGPRSIDAVMLRVIDAARRPGAAARPD